jgi:hypothetical protein
MDKLLEMLGVEKLDESDQSKIKEKLNSIIEIKTKELLESSLKEEKERLIELYEEKFEDYKKEITSKFSNFVDSVIEEEMVIPDNVMEYARKGELYHDLIEQFKIRLSVDEGLLDREVKGLLKEAKEEIINLKKELNQKIDESLEIKEDAQKMASELYLRKKTDGLTESQKEYVFNILGGVVDKEEIDRKFEYVLESAKSSLKEEEKKEDDLDDLNEDKNLKGNGNVESNTVLEDEDDDNPFKNHLKTYVSVLKENKIR